MALDRGVTAMRDQELEIRSFRLVFDLERRIHKIDRFRIPLPYGLPLWSIGYALVAFGLVIIAQRLPGIGLIVAALPAPVRYVLVPCATAWALTQTHLDGRPAHAALLTIARFAITPRRIVAGRAARLGTVCVPDLTVVPDERAARYRPARLTGPAVVLLRNAFGSRERGRTLMIESADDRALMSGTRVRLQAGERLVIR